MAEQQPSDVQATDDADRVTRELREAAWAMVDEARRTVKSLRETSEKMRRLADEIDRRHAKR